MTVNELIKNLQEALKDKKINGNSTVLVWVNKKPRSWFIDLDEEVYINGNAVALSVNKDGVFCG